MKTCFLFLLLLTNHAFSQKRPTQAEMNKMKQQMEAELKQLEKDDPETAKMVKQMMGQIQSKQTKTAAKDAPLPTVISPITPVKLSTPVTTPTDEQAKSKMLWYKGKKINDSTIITTSGSIIQYNRKGSRIVVKPAAGKDPFEKMVKELLKSEIRKKELIDDAASFNNGFFYYRGIVESLEEYNSISQLYQSFLKNTIDLPKTAVRNNKVPGTGKGGYQSFLRINSSANDDDITNAYNEVMQLKSSAPEISVSIPPEKENDLCYACNIDKKEDKYEDARKRWDSIFNLYERTLIHKAIAVEQMIYYAKTPGNTEQFNKMENDLDKVILFAFDRGKEKIDLLQQQFGKDYKRLPIVIEEMIALERQRQLYGLTDNSEVLEKAGDMIKDFDEFLRHEMDVKNYNLVFNVAFILGMERQKQLLGLSDDVSFQYLDMINAFNRFKFELSINFELQSYDSEGKLSMEATSKVETYKEIFVSVGRVDCRYQLFLTDIKYGDENTDEKEYRIPMKVKEGKKIVYDKENGNHTYPYSGPALLYDIFPLVKIDFCKAQVLDTAFIEMPVYQDENLSSLAPSVQNAYTIDMMGYLGLLFFNPKELEGKTQDMESIGKQMLNVFSSNHVQESTGFAKLDQMQENYYIGKELYEKQMQMAQLAINNKLRFLFDAKNNDETLINETNNASRNIDEKMKITKAIVHVRVVHFPGDYRVTPKRKPLVKTNS